MPLNSLLSSIKLSYVKYGPFVSIQKHVRYSKFQSNFASNSDTFQLSLTAHAVIIQASQSLMLLIRALISLLLPFLHYFVRLFPHLFLQLFCRSHFTPSFLPPLLSLCFVVVVDVAVLTLSLGIAFLIRVGAAISERLPAKPVITVVTHAFGEVLQVRVPAVCYRAGLSTCLCFCVIIVRMFFRNHRDFVKVLSRFRCLCWYWFILYIYIFNSDSGQSLYLRQLGFRGECFALWR